MSLPSLLEHEKRPPTDQSLRREMQTIAALQQRLLPRELPRLADWQFDVSYRSGPWPGGDYYDFLPLPEGRLAFVVADASGHGGSSAVMTAQVRVVLHSCPLSSGQERQPFCPLTNIGPKSPAVILNHLNRILEENSLEDQFVTAFYAVLDSATGWLHYASAGHPAPRWWRKAAAAVQAVPEVNGPPLGIGLPASYLQGKILLEAGDVLVCYSDGLLEAQNAFGEMFGCGRLDAAIQEAAAGGAEEVVRHVHTAFRQFLGDAVPHDDVTLLVAARQPAAPSVDACR